MDSSDDLPKEKLAGSKELKLVSSFAHGKTLNQLSETIGTLSPGNTILYHTEGAWSNIELLEHILNQSGPARVYFSTWSISVEAIRRFVAWQSNGLIIELYALLDRGLRNRKPEIYQQAIANFQNMSLEKCHAKIMVVQNKHYDIVVLGSANVTENPRLEAGAIVYDRSSADSFKNLITSKIYGKAKQ